MHFVLNLILFLFLTWIGGIIHAICIVVIYGFCKKEMPRHRRKDRLRAQQNDLFSAPAPSPPCYYTEPANATDFHDDHYVRNVYFFADRASSGGAFAQGSVNTTRYNKNDQVMCPVDEAGPSSTECSETSPDDSKDLGEDRKLA